jgi:signal transduction histidine kinase
MVAVLVGIYLATSTFAILKSNPGYLYGWRLVYVAVSIMGITGFVMLFQRLMGERFERDRLVNQLAQRNSELEEAHRQLSQSVAQEQELAVLRERTRLAREMHDTIGHALVLISVKLEAAQRLRERDPERCDRELESTKEITRSRQISTSFPKPQKKPSGK